MSVVTPYIGRFAPSPTGPLHLGSLYTALASFLDARSHNGLWLLRIDDLDTPRNQPGATTAILDCLTAFGLHWDGEVCYQSRNLQAYEHAIAKLKTQKLLYKCICSRKQLSEFPGVYPGFCRNKQASEIKCALRVKTHDLQLDFDDRVQGHICENIYKNHGDFIIKRSDSIIAYQLAVVIDDNAQQISHVVRGVDLLDSTVKQLFLQQQLGYQAPSYMHVPILIDQDGNKLSKQTCATAVNPAEATKILFELLIILKQNPPSELRYATKYQILAWAIAHWRPELLKQIQVIQPAITSNL